MARELRPLRLGETLAESFTIYTENFAALFGMSAVISVLGQLVTRWLGGLLSVGVPGATPATIAAALTGIVITYGGALLITSLLPALMIDFMARIYKGEPASVGGTISAIIPRILPLIGIMLLRGLAVLVPVVLLTLTMSPFLMLVGYAIAIYLMILLAFSMEVFVAEGMSPVASIKRSISLTKGYRGRIMGYSLVVGIISSIVTAIGLWIVRLLALSGIGASILTGLISAVVSPFTYAVLILLYFTARIEKEGFDLEHLADQFGAAADSGDSTVGEPFGDSAMGQEPRGEAPRSEAPQGETLRDDERRDGEPSGDKPPE